LRYAANIGGHESPVACGQISTAMLPERCPAVGFRTIDIEILGSALQDHDPQYWITQRDNLDQQFARRVRERIEARGLRHLSIFALAPQLLLIELGRLLCAIAPADIFQLHREPKRWRWPPDAPPITFRVREPMHFDGPIGLALSATVTGQRITDVLGADV
jgi:SMODS-associated and fused to various effectors sensor domain